MAALLACAAAAFGQTRAPVDPAALYRQARELLAMGETYRAIDALMSATAANPAYADAWAALAECQYELREYERALEFIALAAKYGPRGPSLLNLEGFCLVALGRVDEARKAWADVLAKLPNDRDARFGLALLDLRSGRPADARARLSESLRLSPRDPRALLSLALITRAEGRAAESATYLAEALKWAADDPDVSYAAASLAAESGDAAEASRLAQLAIKARPAHAGARNLLAGLYFERGALAEARAVLDQSLRYDRKDYQAWFLMGMVEAAAGNFPEAEYALSSLLRMRPDDEMARLAAENLVMDDTSLEDPVRSQYAAWRFARADEFERRLLYDKAAAEYRRGLAIDPYANQGRRRYADLLRMARLYSSYYGEISFLKDIGKADQALDDALEVYRSFLQDAVSSEWKADALALAERPYRLAVYSAGPGGTPWHAGSDLVAARYIRDLFTSSPQIAPERSVPRVADFADAYRLARESGADYFLLVRVAETDRDVLISAELRTARTGALAARIEAPRSGNDRVTLAAARVVSQVSAALPTRGTLLSRKGDLALGDLGKLDGVAVGDVFLVIKNGAVSVKSDGSGLAWADADAVASFTVTRVDDEACEGKLERIGFFDRVNPRDALVRKPAAPAGTPSPGATGSTAAPAAVAPTAATPATTWSALFEKVRGLY